MNYDERPILANAVKAIQELSTENEELKNKVSMQDKIIASMLERLNKLEEKS